MSRSDREARIRSTNWPRDMKRGRRRDLCPERIKGSGHVWWPRPQRAVVIQKRIESVIHTTDSQEVLGFDVGMWQIEIEAKVEVEDGKVGDWEVEVEVEVKVEGR